MNLTLAERRRRAAARDYRWVVMQCVLGWPMWRAELWYKPFNGHMLACTRWVSTRAWARRDGRRVFADWPEAEQ